jgi:type I restriction enzyme S subunit
MEENSMEWTEYKLGDLIKNSGVGKYKANSKKLSGNYPLVTTEMNVDYFVDEFNYDGKYIMIQNGLQGPQITNIKYFDGKFSSTINMFTFNLNEDVIFPKFLFYTLKSRREKISKNCFQGSANTNLSISLLKKEIINLPPLDHQIKVANFLDKISGAIADAKKEVELNEELLETTMNLLLQPGE